MGLSNKKTTTKETATTERTNPSWVTDALSGFTGQVSGLLDNNPDDYVAPANPLQSQAGAAAAGLGGWQGLAKDAAAPTSQVGSSSLLQGLDSYMSPYREDVVDATLADFDANAGQTRAAQAAAGARNSAFGGSRFGVAEAQTEEGLGRARATADATLRDSMFNTGAGLSNMDAGRRQEAALANQRAEMADRERQLSAAGLMGSGSRADAELQMGIGGALRDIDSEERQSELGLLGAVGGLLGQGQYGLFNGSNSSGTSVSKSDEGLLGGLASIGGAVKGATALAGLFSDARTKTDVETLGRDSRGRRWVSYRYLWDAPDAPLHTGVMAQEVRETDPGAVITGPLGLLMVDYRKLEGSPWVAS